MFSSLNRWVRPAVKKDHTFSKRLARQTQTGRRRRLFEALEDRALLAGLPTVAATTPALPQTIGAISSLDITYSENVAGSDQIESYTLVRAGVDGQLGTGDDVTVAINSVTVGNPTVTLNFSSLIEGSYRLTIDSTAVTAIDDGAQLDGDVNGTAGGDFVVDFDVDAEANDAPTVTFDVASYTAIEQTALNLLGTGIVIADVDADAGELVATLTTSAGGTLTATAGNSNVAVTGSGSSNVTLTGTIEELGAYFLGATSGTLSYQFNANVVADDTLTISVNDQGNAGGGGALTGEASIDIGVIAVNDAPTVTITLPNYNLEPGGLLSLQGTGISIADVDAANGLVQANLNASLGTLSVNPGSTSVSVAGSGSGSVSLTGTVNQINALLSGQGSASVVFNPGVTAATSANLSVNVNDQGNTGTGGAQSANANVTINLSAQVGDSLEVVVGFNPITGQWIGTTLPGTGTGETKVLAQWATAAQVGWQNGLTGDFDGDGVVDVLARTATGGWWVGLSEAGGYSTSFWGQFVGNQTWSSIQVGDVNNDGLDDVIGYLPSVGQWWVGVSNGTSFTNHMLAQFSTEVTWSDFLVADFTGDSRVDVAARTNFGEWWMGTTNATVGVPSQLDLLTTWSTEVTWRDVVAADFDGDGTAEILGRADFNGLDGSEWWLGNVQLNAPNDYVALNSKVGTWFEPVGWTVVVADTDGDGSDEILGRSGFGEWWQISADLAGSTVKLGTWANVNWEATLVGDVDGDGSDDLIGRQANGAWLVSSFEGGVQTDITPATWASDVDWLFSDFGLDDDLLFS